MNGGVTADRDIVEIATGQYGAFTRVQAHGVGMTDDRIPHRMRQGWLHQIGPNAFRLPGTDTTPHARLFGLMLDVGEPVWAFGPTAAALHHFDGFDLGPPFHLVVPRGRQVRRVGSSIHTSQHLPHDDCTEIAGIRVMRPARTLIDLGRIVDRAMLTRAYDAAVRDRLVNEDALIHRVLGLLDHSGHRLGAEELLAVINGSEIERGAHSFLKRRFLHLMDEHEMPRPETQHVAGWSNDRLIRVDFRFPGTNVVVEVLGYHYHRSREQMAIDAQRMNQLIADGFRPYQFTYEQVMERERMVVHTVAAALQQTAA